MPSVKSTVKGFNKWPQLIKKLQSLEANIVMAGYDDRPHPESGEGLATVALANNYGTDHILSRPFMNDANDYTAAAASRHNVVVRDIVYGGYTVKASMKEMAEDVAQTIKEVLETGNYPVTNNETPLIKTSFMLQNTKPFVGKRAELGD